MGLQQLVERCHVRPDELPQLAPGFLHPDPEAVVDGDVAARRAQVSLVLAVERRQLLIELARVAVEIFVPVGQVAEYISNSLLTRRAFT
jgi:hypothetical protein